MAAMSEKSINVLNYLKGVKGNNVIAADIAEATGYSTKAVNAIVNSLSTKGLAVRSDFVEVLVGDETKKVKFISVTDEGMAFDPAAATDAE